MKDKIINRADLVSILEGDISKIDSIYIRAIDRNEFQVHVKPKHVENMLLRFLNNQINSDDLTRWAYFICARTEYGNEFYLDFEKADFYEDMFYIIQRLSTPQIDGEVNEKSVRGYLVELQKYSDEL